MAGTSERPTGIPEHDTFMPIPSEKFIMQVATEATYTTFAPNIPAEEQQAEIPGIQSEDGVVQWNWPRKFDNGVTGSTILNTVPELDKDGNPIGLHITILPTAYITHVDQEIPDEIVLDKNVEELMEYVRLPLTLTGREAILKKKELLGALQRAAERTEEIVQTIPAPDTQAMDEHLTDLFDRVKESKTIWVLNADELRQSS